MIPTWYRLWSKEQRILACFRENLLLAPSATDGVSKKDNNVYQTSTLRVSGQNKTNNMKYPTFYFDFSDYLQWWFSVVFKENLHFWVLIHMDYGQPVVSKNLHRVDNVNPQGVCTIGCLNIGEYTVKLPGAFWAVWEEQQQHHWKEHPSRLLHIYLLIRTGAIWPTLCWKRR